MDSRNSCIHYICSQYMQKKKQIIIGNDLNNKHILYVKLREQLHVQICSCCDLIANINNGLVDFLSFMLVNIWFAKDFIYMNHKNEYYLVQYPRESSLLHYYKISAEMHICLKAFNGIFFGRYIIYIGIYVGPILRVSLGVSLVYNLTKIVPWIKPLYHSYLPEFSFLK